MQEILFQARKNHPDNENTNNESAVWENILQEYLSGPDSKKTNMPFLFVMHEIMRGLIEANKHHLNSYSPFQFIEFCLQDEHLTIILLGQLLNLPVSNNRDELLIEIGHLLFMRSVPGTRNILEIINAHICFSEAASNSYMAKTLYLETYRAILNDIGLIDHDEFDLNSWKPFYTQRLVDKQSPNMIQDLDNLISAQKNHLLACLKLEANPGTSVYNTMLILSQRDMKAKVQDEIKIKHKMHM